MKENKIVMKQISSLILLAASALLASCTQDEFKDGIVPPGNSLYISSAVVGTGSHTETEAATRADVGDVPVTVTKGSLGIFRSQGTGYSSTLDNVKYTYKGADQGWQAATAADTLFLNGGDADVCAYYPYNGDATYSDKTIILLTSGKYTGTADVHDPNDICYDTDRTMNGSRRATTFELKHALAMLECKITKDADYKGDCRITSVSVLNPELILSSDIDITNGTYGTTPVKRTLTYNPGSDADGILIGNTPFTTAALLLPFVPAADGVTIAFSVNGVSVEAVIPNGKMPKVEAGHRYTANIVMKATSMQVTGVDMLAWEETGVGGDDYTWYPSEDVIKLTDPVHIASYDWAWSNLDYVDGAITLRDNQTWQDNHMVHWPYCVLDANTSSNGAAIPGSSIYNYATDPCSVLNPTLGGTWTLPNKHQIGLLMASDHVNSKEGCWFGTSTAPAKDDGTYLFLPANSELFNDFGSPDLNIGAYWLSDGGPYTLFCVGTESSTYPEISDRSTGVAYNGQVRCVQKARETIILDGVEWAMGNLVKKTDGTYVIDEYQAAMPVLTGSSTATWTDVNRGYHYTWNSLDRNSMADNAAYDYDIANDPCTKVVPAGTWRTPTKEDFEKAMAKGNVKGSYVINGVTVEGYYLGTNTTPAKGGGDEYLFLPMAGGGDQSSYYDFYSQYWTSTEKEGSEGGSEAYAFNGSKFGTTGDMSVHSKSHPMAIRCVKK